MPLELRKDTHTLELTEHIGMIQYLWAADGDDRLRQGVLRTTLTFVPPDTIATALGANPKARGWPIYFALVGANVLAFYPPAAQDYIIGGRYFPPMKEL